MITETDTREALPPRGKRPFSGRAVLGRKLRVDEAHRLDLADLKRNGALDHTKGGRPWTSRAQPGLAGPPSEAAYVVVAEADRRRLLLGHTEGPGSHEPRIYEVQLTATPCHFGGWRWWFRCPLVVRGVPCNRRCRILYRPPGAPYFGCRECWRLTYRCRQLHRNLAYEGPGRAGEVMDEMIHDPCRRARRKLWFRGRQLQRTHRSMQRFLARMEVRLAKAAR